jgi:hypothetical protein
MSRRPELFARLTVPGAVLWIVPRSAGIRAWAEEGAGTGDELVGQSLPVGRAEGSSSIALALAHVSA